jgi:hypothetical protein
MHRILTPCRTGLSVVTAVLLLTACGGSDGNEAAPSSRSTTAATSSPQADSEFCTEAASIQERIGATFDESDPSSLSQVLEEGAAEIRAIEPPPEIADDWNTLADGFEQIAAALADVDLNDPAAQQSLQAQLGQLQAELTTASANVQKYLAEECGIELDPSETAAPTS